MVKEVVRPHILLTGWTPLTVSEYRRQAHACDWREVDCCLTCGHPKAKTTDAGQVNFSSLLNIKLTVVSRKMLSLATTCDTRTIVMESPCSSVTQYDRKIRAFDRGMAF
jgi:hypothetical protein